MSKARIADKLSKSINKFFNPSAENIPSGVAGILGTAMNALMGAGEGMEAKNSHYMVVVEYPAIIRLDFAMWVRNTRASGLMSHCKHAISVVSYKSAVDINKLDFATFLAIYAPILNNAFGNDQKQIKQLIEESKEVYGMLAGNDDTPSNAGPIASDDSKLLLSTGGKDPLEIITKGGFPAERLGYFKQVNPSKIMAF